MCQKTICPSLFLGVGEEGVKRSTITPQPHSSGNTQSMWCPTRCPGRVNASPKLRKNTYKGYLTGMLDHLRRDLNPKCKPKRRYFTGLRMESRLAKYFLALPRSIKLMINSYHYDMSIWQRVAMDSLKFHLSLPCSTLLHPVGGLPLKRHSVSYSYSYSTPSDTPHNTPYAYA
jgi:hypothetical protein